MVAVEKPDIKELVSSLEELDGISLLLIDSGAKLLAARQAMETEGKLIEEGGERDVKENIPRVGGDTKSTPGRC